MRTQPAYREIEAWLRELLPTKREGDLLPTVTEIYERFGVSGVQTVRDGYQPLIEEGWVRVQQRPQRRWVVAKVPEPRSSQVNVPRAVFARLARIEEAMRGVVRDVEALKGDLEQMQHTAHGTSDRRNRRRTTDSAAAQTKGARP